MGVACSRVRTRVNECSCGHSGGMLTRHLQRLIDTGLSSRVPPDELLDSVLPDIGNTAEKATAFWALLVCSSIVAAIGVLVDSTATVIGAMVIAPLGTPIYGISAALVSGARVGPVAWRLLTGMLLVIAIGILMDLVMLDFYPISANPQVVSRTNPSLPDLGVALATGVAGALALVRRDISPALPGVAIAISLVPPLAVVGICVANEAWSSAFGALVLFGTNVMAIVLASLLVFGAARLALPEGSRKVRSRHAVWLLAIVTVVVLASLSAGTLQAIRLYQDQQAVQRAATKWADERADWTLQSVVRKGDRITVTFLGSGDTPEHLDKRNATLAAKLQQQGVRVDVQFVEGSLRRVA